MSNYLTTDTELTSIANAIRTKGGTSGQLEYPTGFVTAIGDIPTGGTYSETLLWTNPNLTADFPSQILGISVSGYDYIKVIYTRNPGAGAANYQTMMIAVSLLKEYPAVEETFYPLIGTTNDNYYYWRRFYDANRLGITDCYFTFGAGISANWTWLKPVQIYGVKI